MTVFSYTLDEGWSKLAIDFLSNLKLCSALKLNTDASLDIKDGLKKCIK